VPQRVFHDLCLHIVWQTKNDERLERAARDDVSGRKHEKPTGVVRMAEARDPTEARLKPRQGGAKGRQGGMRTAT